MVCSVLIFCSVGVDVGLNVDPDLSWSGPPSVSTGLFIGCESSETECGVSVEYLVFDR